MRDGTSYGLIDTSELEETGISPELLAMVKDVKPASDEETALILNAMSGKHKFDTSNAPVMVILSLIARIVAERKVDDAMVERALTAADYTWDENASEWMRRALEAALEERGS